MPATATPSARLPNRRLVSLGLTLALVALAGFTAGWVLGPRPAQVGPPSYRYIVCSASESHWINSTATVPGDQDYGCLFVNANVTFTGNLTVEKLVWIRSRGIFLTVQGTFTVRGVLVFGDAVV